MNTYNKNIRQNNVISKMASFFAIVTFCAFFTSCCKDDPADPNAKALVKIHVSDFTISQDAFYGPKSAEDLADYTNVGAIDLAFYEGYDRGLQDHATAFRQQHLHHLR